MDIYPVGLLRKEGSDKAVRYHHIIILAVETLSCAIHNSDAIRGIQVDDCEIKITQLADDTTCFVKDKASLRHLLSIF